MDTPERIYKEGDPDAYSMKWITELNQSGYAGINRIGRIIDRREYPKAVAIQTNSLFNVVKPKPL